jgi:hypothetical protein
MFPNFIREFYKLNFLRGAESMERREFLQSSFGVLARAMITRGSGTGILQAPGGAQRILYVLGQFSAGTPDAMRSAADAMGHSGFNILVVAFLQVSLSAGKLNLSYNGNAFSAVSPEVAALLARLRSGYGARKRLMMSIGGWASTANFEAIRSFGVPAFVQRLTQEVIVPMGIEGIDLDPEPSQGGMDQWMHVHREFGKTLTDLTNEYKRVHPSHLVTHSPIAQVAAAYYAKGNAQAHPVSDLLEATRIQRGNNIDWLNVQFYEGGMIENGDIAGFYRDSLAAPLLERRAKTGIANPMNFFTPLFEPEAKQPLAFCQRTLRLIDQRCADLHAGGLTGVALWDYRQIAPTIGEWSRGLQAALSPQGKI